MYSICIALSLIALSGFMVEVKGHGRLIEPASRASMWRYGFSTPPNYNDNQLFCGGFWRQKKLGGKCGFCGDPYDSDRPHETGKYNTGTIARTYTQGQTINVTVQITAAHKGWFEFHLCVVNKGERDLTDTCIPSRLQKLSSPDDVNKFYGIQGTGDYSNLLVLPAGQHCENQSCILQWKYHAGNSWGVSSNGTGCVGCGPQEEFYACADINITASDTSVLNSTLAPDPVQESPSASENPTPASAESSSSDSSTSSCKAVGAWVGKPEEDAWCVTLCAVGYCPSSHCSCPSSPTPSTPCKGAGDWTGNSGMDTWCVANCPSGNCPASLCTCD